MKSLFVFRRDLRLEDNTALHEALKNSDRVVCCFILDPRQLGSSYRSDNAVQFMITSLKELDQQLRHKGSRLFLFEGKPEDVIKKLIENEHIDALYFNKDYTPFSIKRDRAIEKLCISKKVAIYSLDDVLLTSPGSVLTTQQKPYTIYSAFVKKARLNTMEKPRYDRFSNYYKGTISSSKNTTYLHKVLAKENPDIMQEGGRSEALDIIKRLDHFKNYRQKRDFPSLQGTTRLSAHNKFGTISIRELYWAIRNKLGKNHPLIAELFWRDFFTHVIAHFPHVLGHSFYQKYDRISWKKEKKIFQRWCQGKTGYPIIDAGMRELNTTGWMHNRVRMLCASFLVKDLHIDWRWGEKYFAQHLVDYDPAVNNGNWQWIASTGCDAQPYFRIFNPWLQQKKFDADCLYIKKWVTELSTMPVKDIHDPSKSYLPLIVDHNKESVIAKKMYKK